MEGREKHIPPEGKRPDGSVIKHIKTKLFGKEIVTGYEVVTGNPQELPREPQGEPAEKPSEKPKKRSWNIPGTDIPRPPDVSFIEKSQTRGDLEDD